MRDLDVPYVCSGGVGTGAQLAAALALGAGGVNLGNANSQRPTHDTIQYSILLSIHTTILTTIACCCLLFAARTTVLVTAGTRFMATVEAPIHQNIKQALVDGDHNSTTFVLKRYT